MKFNRFEEIDVWNLSRSLVKEIYNITHEKPLSKDFGLRDQIRRCAISIPSNIAEGYERKSNNEFTRFLFIAKGSAGELRTQLYLAKDLKYINEEIFDTVLKKCEDISKSLSGFIKYLQSTI
jgi:four helix bundle protein